MNVHIIAFTIYFATQLSMGHFLLGYGIMGGTWDDIFDFAATENDEDSGPRIEKMRAAYNLVGTPLSVGAAILLVQWPACLAMYWALRPGGRSYG